MSVFPAKVGGTRPLRFDAIGTTVAPYLGVALGWLDSRLLVSVLAVCVGACTAELSGGVEFGEVPLPPTEPEPDSAGRTTFETTILPLLEDRCAVCHADPAMAPAFLTRNPDVYDTVMAWPSLVVVEAPEQSRLITKGEHDGPAWEQAQVDEILAWVAIEANPPEEPIVPDDDDPIDDGEDDGEAVPDEPLCRDLEAFATLARPALDDRCGNCHAGDDEEATLALDLTPPPEARAVVCTEVAGFVDRDRPMASLLFTAVDPLESGTHPFDFNGSWPTFGEFRTSLLQWINDSD